MTLDDAPETDAETVTREDREDRIRAHGGTRPGAGRPPVNPEGATMQCSISIPAVLVAKIDALSEKNNMSRNGVAVALLRKMLSD